MREEWWSQIIDQINFAIVNKAISKESLAEGMEEIEDHAGEWARQLRSELQ